MLHNILTLSSLFVALNGDCYLHYFRGSNNRLNEASANRNNANRLFDSQNNNRGGYNCCDLDPEEGFDEDTWMPSASEMYDWRRLYSNDDTPLEKQYEEIYFASTDTVESSVSITWTNQHGTGNRKLLSQMILQYGCDTFPRATSAGINSALGGPESNIQAWTTLGDGSTCNQACRDTRKKMRRFGLRMELLNGGNTNQPDDPDAITGNNGITDTYTDNNAANEGRHESEEWYYLCEKRKQNWGLFHADQNLQGKSQKYTRQNPAGTRRGLECPEERDYYPWWNPTPWHDIAIITPEMEYCTNHQAPMSQNVMDKCGCNNPTDPSSSTSNDVENWFPAEEYRMYNLNETACELMGGKWECFKWNGVEPECVDSYWTKVNYLGNADGTSRGGKQAHYDWRLPTYNDLRDNHYCYPYDYTIDDSPHSTQDSSTNIKCVRMVFRIRYNISTMDYDPYKTNSTHDYDPSGGILSPIEENPEVDVGFYVQGLQLAINTAQTGRTFQDRSHTFLVCQRDSSSDFYSKNILNVNVRGKRGNIVQTFPATEYDFEPQHIEVKPKSNQCFHFQWCGSNTHNNGSPGGDGQTGDSGAGTGGTDRSNLVQMRKMDESYPVTYDKIDSDSDFFEYVNCYHPLLPQVELSKKDAQLILGTAGFYKSESYMKEFCAAVTSDASGNNENRGNCIVDELLNNVSASFRAGLICCIKPEVTLSDSEEKEFAFVSTRNNDFTNRCHKLKIVITNTPDDTSLW
eukprot:958847_1